MYPNYQTYLILIYLYIYIPCIILDTFVQGQEKKDEAFRDKREGKMTEMDIIRQTGEGDVLLRFT